MAKPNIVVLLTDQQSATMMSCAGNPWVTTPAMDGLSGRGTRFERAYCTNPVCVPSRFSLVTGRMPSAIGLRCNDNDHISRVPPAISGNGLGHLLRRAGYDTVYAGKVHLPKLSATDVGFRTLSDDRRDELAATCAAFLEREHDRPFCLYASFINPHDICYFAERDLESNKTTQWLERNRTPLETLEKALALPIGVSTEEFLQRLCPPLPSNHAPQVDEPEALQYLLDRYPYTRHAREDFGETEWRMHRWAYCRLTEMVDAQIGLVLDGLARGPHRDNTLVVFSSDHGDMDAGHKLEHKTVFYEESARIPFIVSWPGHVRSGVVDHETLVSNGLDLLPTLCDYAGAVSPADLGGISLRTALEGSRSAAREVIPVENEIGMMLVGRRYKYMRFDFGRHAEQLIDLESDPGETRNVLGEPSAASALCRMRGSFAYLTDGIKDEEQTDGN